ncbi:MAG TPA: HD domain-containing protein [Vicinamibacterales bacterium]|nr:HD domain-containing protein [Vicinamibacterales bacterium]
MPGTAPGREPRLSDLAAALAAARREYLSEARLGRAGVEVHAGYAERMDGLVEQLVERARHLTRGAVAVCACGGYGRQRLSLHSDIDLLILFEHAMSDGDERFVKAVLQPLWDLQLVVGHHIRELDDFAGLDHDNIEFVLALLDARMIAGEARLFDGVQAWLAEAIPLHRPALLDGLLQLVAHRHGQFNDTIYQLEPDIKMAPGGLRDIAAVRHLRALDAAAFEDDPIRTGDLLAECEERLLRVRSILHAENGRDANVLTHPLQEKVADVLGYAGDAARPRVEALMGDYFRTARAVVRTLARAQARVHPPSAEPPRAIGRHFEIGADGLRFIDPDGAATRPQLWLEMFRLAIARGCAVAPAALDCIGANRHRYGPDDFTATEAERQQLLQLLHPRAGLYARLSEMHDCGLLHTIFPEFERIYGRVVRDFYHKYTVDEHTLLAIRGLELLSTSAVPGRSRFTALLQEVHAPELLTLALLLHDLGKWRDTDHAAESVRIAQSVLDRLELSGDGRHTVEFLIRNHLQMSQVAFRRDLDDPQVIEAFSHLVGTEEQLKMLCLLTLVDVDAVSPTTLTPWKEELLWRLYVDAYNHLTLGYADELVPQDPAGLAVVIAGRPDDIGQSELTRFLTGLPRRYLALFGLAGIYRHVRLARGIRRDEVHTFLEQHDEVWELTIVTLDKPFLFSNVSGVLSYFGMDIHRGQAMTTPEGLVLDVFEFSDAEGFLRQNPGAPTEISRMLDRVVAGWVDVPGLLRGRERSVVYRAPQPIAPRVHVDNEYSRKYTVVEIVAADGPGLLYRVSRVISEQGCDLDLVLINTEGSKAIDVLHVTRAGQKLTEAERTALRQGLEGVLEARDETR